MTQRLKNNIEEIYKSFAKYSATDMTGSRLYEDKLPIWNKEILSKPLRELNEDDLSLYAGKAITTWGNARDYKHFLPRILELTAELRQPYEIDIAFDRIEMAEFKNWSEEERDLIYEFMLALWESILNDNSRKAEFEFDGYFSAIIYYYPKFNDLLEIWETSESKASVKHLADYVVQDAHLLFKGKGFFGYGVETFSETPEEIGQLGKIDEPIESDYQFNKDDPNKIDIFKKWLLSDNTLDKLQRKYFEFESEEFAERISWAEKIIDTERRSTAHNKV